MNEEMKEKRRATITARMVDAYMSALARLTEEKPTHPDLKKMLSMIGSIPITQENVALEARRSRDPLSRNRYPAVVVAIRAAAGKPSPDQIPSMTARVREAALELDAKDVAMQKIKTQLLQVTLKLEQTEQQLRHERLRSQRADREKVTEFPPVGQQAGPS